MATKRNHKSKRNVVSKYAQLVERGCLCGTERPQDCPVHKKPGDNRGLAAFFAAGMPFAFPSKATCGTCGAEGLMYPNVQHAEPGDPTLICPNCSTRSAESLLRFRLELEGLHKLNGKSVFGTARPYLVQDMQDMLERGTEDQQAECKAALAESWHATEDGSDWTFDFALNEDGRKTMSAGRPPSFALALLFDWENHMRGERTALVWADDAEQVADAA
jgi:hypothetical protein